MRYQIGIVLIISLLLSLPLVAETTGSAEQHYTPGILLVKIADLSQEKTAVKFLFALGALEVKPLVRKSGRISPDSPLYRWRKVTFSKDADLKKLLEEVSANPLFEHAELNGAITIQ